MIINFEMHRVPRTQKGLFAVFRLFNFIFHWLTINLRIFQLRKKKIQDTESLISSKLTDNSNSTVVFQTFGTFKMLVKTNCLRSIRGPRCSDRNGTKELNPFASITKNWTQAHYHC
jgi:hypothetical protein